MTIRNCRKCGGDHFGSTVCPFDDNSPEVIAHQLEQTENRKKKQAVIFDIDGTLADVEHRIHHIRKEPPDWNAFNAEMHDDAIKEDIRHLVYAMFNKGYFILLVTGRFRQYHVATDNWLNHHGVLYHNLYMRPDGDFRSDYIIKEEIYQQLIKPHYKVLFVVEDRKTVVEMWRRNGLTCLQCAEGDY